MLFLPNPWEPGYTVRVDVAQPDMLDESFIHNPESQQYFVILSADYFDEHGEMFVERCVRSKDLRLVTRCWGHNNAYLKRPSYWPKSDNSLLNRIRSFLPFHIQVPVKCRVHGSAKQSCCRGGNS